MSALTNCLVRAKRGESKRDFNDRNAREQNQRTQLQFSAVSKFCDVIKNAATQHPSAISKQPSMLKQPIASSLSRHATTPQLHYPRLYWYLWCRYLTSVNSVLSALKLWYYMTLKLYVAITALIACCKLHVVH